MKWLRTWTIFAQHTLLLTLLCYFSTKGKKGFDRNTSWTFFSPPMLSKDIAYSIYYISLWGTHRVKNFDVFILFTLKSLLQPRLPHFLTRLMGNDCLGIFLWLQARNFFLKNFAPVVPYGVVHKWRYGRREVVQEICDNSTNRLRNKKRDDGGDPRTTWRYVMALTMNCFNKNLKHQFSEGMASFAISNSIQAMFPARLVIWLVSELNKKLHELLSSAYFF